MVGREVLTQSKIVSQREVHLSPKDYYDKMLHHERAE
jgi:hypothetical protein